VSEPRLEEIELMHPMDHQPFSSPEWIFEFKYDGYRVVASGDRLLTRQKRDATTWFPEIAEPLRKLRSSFIVDGEICLLDARGVPNFEAMRGRVRRKETGDLVTFCIFDLLFRNGRDVRQLALVERKELLRKLLPRDHPRLKYVDHLPERGMEMFKFATSAGMEGIVGKRADSAYEGKRSRLWLKMKQPGFHDGWERPTRRELA
jgi:bifunctional non-homologous end joining protein LigD